MRSLITSSTIRAVLLGSLFLCLIQVADSQVASSTNYQLQSDSINVGGGFSSSTNFQQESTVGELATGRSTSTSYALRAGYQQMQEVFLSMTAAANVTMNTAIPGITGGSANGTSSVLVTTDSPSGYQLTIAASDSPAMQGVNGSIADYPATSTPDFIFNITPGQAYFGFSVLSPDVASGFLDDGANCATGSQNNAGRCWSGLSTDDVVISRSTEANQPAGATTTLQFQVGVGSGANVASGLYIATTTLTALPL